MRITLIGFMGSGKTTVAQELSQQLALPNNDLDTLIEQAAGLTIPAYFEQFGEAHFRQLEQKVLTEALSLEGILSTGGGTPVQVSNQDLLQNQDGPVIFLDASDQTITTRLLADGVASRPLFQQLGMDGLLELKQTRQPIYEKIASEIITVDGKQPAEIAEEIIHTINVSI
ncbi:shikimate kinase [Fructobacillus tropaeoli]|uniref:Shikimate kinase n=1 Tax=Fructobacillus tropaeoli TaxID=709323 RepID=A0ABM9N046_9LACO|nr:shikimate kinase [Fructobacillus tropaeoli]GIC70746.1 shikimate kinase [Fructobacillus tropaeoli]CAK1252021.1 Shikimate kinase (AroK) [Fructobacillus tropaeoli]